MLADASNTTINSVSLTTMGLVLTGPIAVGEAVAATSFVSVPGMDGSIDLTLRNAVNAAYLGRRNITLPLATVGTKAQVAAAKAAIGSYNGKDVYVYDERFGGEWHGMLTLGAWTDRVESWGGQLSASVTATVMAEPALLMPTETVVLDSSQSTITVKGNRPAWPHFELVPTRSSYAIGVTVSSGGVDIGTARYVSSSHIANNVDVDCYMGVVTSNGAILPTSLNEDFPILVPGSVTITPIGCASGTMTYRPRVMV